MCSCFPFPRYNFNAAICESQCKRSDHCQFWRVYQNESMQLPECLHLRTNYHQVNELNNGDIGDKGNEP